MIPDEAGIESGVVSEPRENIWESRRLWSLWDMLDKFAWSFFVLAEFLTQLNKELDIALPSTFVPVALPPALSNMMGDFFQTGASPNSPPQNSLALPYPPPPPEPSGTIQQAHGERIIRILGFVENSCRQIGMVGVTRDREGEEIY